jgi:hypothetical protein
MSAARRTCARVRAQGHVDRRIFPAPSQRRAPTRRVRRARTAPARAVPACAAQTPPPRAPSAVRRLQGEGAALERQRRAMAARSAPLRAGAKQCDVRDSVGEVGADQRVRDLGVRTQGGFSAVGGCSQ